MPRYALVIIETPASRSAIRTDRHAHRSALTQWMKDRAADGILLGGEAFETESITPATIRRGASGLIVDRKPHHHGLETLGGYVLITAADMDAAIEIAKTWPETGEAIEVRPLWEPPAPDSVP